MRNRFRGPLIAVAGAAAFVIFIFALAVMPAGGQATRPARTPDGKPHLDGIWQVMNTANWDLLAHGTRPMVGQPGVDNGVQVLAAPVVALGAAGIVPPGLGVVEGNEISYNAEGAARKRENAENSLDLDPELRCFEPGVPRAMYLPHPFRIVQGTNKIFMQFQFADASRTIHLDPAEPPPDLTWMGHSIGRWERDTLVIDSSNFNDRTWFSRAGDHHSEQLKVTERITPITPDALRYEATVEDPLVFTRPWKMSMVIYRHLEDDAQIMEDFKFRCVELAEETFIGNLRKQQLVKHWEGERMSIDITRKVPPPGKLYQLGYQGWIQ